MGRNGSFRSVPRTKRYLRERCLMVERTLQAEEDLQEVPVEYQEMWDYMEEVSERERRAMTARRTGNSSQGGGGWPSTAARSP
ncbi:hypothetical protein FF1_005593 [Malus domestica]